MINDSQGQALWNFWLQRGGEQAGFSIVHVLYYLGGLIAIGAMTLFTALIGLMLAYFWRKGALECR